MPSLNPMHPAQLLVGALIIGQRLARKVRNFTLEVICRDAREFGEQTCDLIREVAADAANLEDEIRAVGADGVITAPELEKLTARAREIQEQAVTGRITA